MNLIEQYIKLLIKENSDTEYDGMPEKIEALAEELYNELLSDNDFIFNDLKLLQLQKPDFINDIAYKIYNKFEYDNKSKYKSVDIYQFDLLLEYVPRNRAINLQMHGYIGSFNNPKQIYVASSFDDIDDNTSIISHFISKIKTRLSVLEQELK